MKKLFSKYFLGANSCEGFVSAFSESYDPTDGWRAILIKGGPGTGKSSFMKYIAAKAQKKDLETVLCPCSSDPDSLDGVIIPEKKTVVLDTTAPHIVEPKFPGACEEILNLGAYWNSDKLKERADEVIAATECNKLIHRTASRYLAAAGQLLLDDLRLANDCTDADAVERFAEGLCRRNIPDRTGTSVSPREQVRFIEGITPLGIVAYCKSITDKCENIAVIQDKHGSVSGLIMRRIREYALNNGYNIITLKNPFLPSLLIDHIIIPELSLAFVTENEYLEFDTDSRRIHSRRFTDTNALKQHRGRMLFDRRAARELIESACAALARAKSSHDLLERFYIESMDFESLSSDADGIAERILK